MDKVQINDGYFFRMSGKISEGKCYAIVLLHEVRNDAPRGSLVVDSDSHEVVPSNLQQTEATIVKMMENMAKRNGITPEQQRNLDALVALCDEVEKMYPAPTVKEILTPAPTKKRRWFKW